MSSAHSYVLFDEAGKFLAGRLMSEAEASAQVELDTGKRVKVKAANVLLRFAQPGPAELLPRAQAQAADIDLDLIWDAAPDDEFGFEALASDYFGEKAGTVEKTAMLIRLFDTPHYFHRRGKGRFRKAPQEIVQAALAAIEKKKLVAAQIQAWADELIAGRCPEPVREQLYRILFKPDKNGPEYKAVVEAAQRAKAAPLDLLVKAGAIASPYQFHWRRFLAEHFPKGTGFPALAVPPVSEELPLAPVQAYSIDDSATTEIDDALSVQGLGTGTVVFGIHIAAPALALLPGSPADLLARSRWSTVYMPGHKLTMLPDDIVQAYTLAEGQACPAVSLYVSFDEATLEVRARETRLERVPIAANLRHDKLDAVVTEAVLEGSEPAPADMPWPEGLRFAFRLARHLKAQREVVRGKPETFNRPDYNFRLEGPAIDAGQEPTGDETVLIGERRRGAPLDLIVAEAMILANSSWGGWLAELGVPGIYRSQASLAPGIKVRMGTKALPHAGMGVAQYTWATSPLRRYVDLVNQWQIVACARHGRTAALAAPFKPKDAELFSVISGFDAAYTAYNQFQNGMERYWTLRLLEQQGLQELDAAVMKDGLVRCDTLPLVLRAIGTENLPRGTRVRIGVSSVDLLTLDAQARLLSRLDDKASAAAGPEDELEDDLAAEAAPVALAIDLESAPETEGGASARAEPAPVADAESP